jgi:hypothetical protein
VEDLERAEGRRVRDGVDHRDVRLRRVGVETASTRRPVLTPPGGATTWTTSGEETTSPTEVDAK